MRVEDLRVTLFTTADKSDPLNVAAVASARGFVDGKRSHWKGEAKWSLHPGETHDQTLERAIENLIKHMIAVPFNPVE